VERHSVHSPIPVVTSRKKASIRLKIVEVACCYYNEQLNMTLTITQVLILTRTVIGDAFGVVT
jgi:hypothetical protein